MKLPTFDEVMEITGPVSNIHVLQLVECQSMYETLCELPEGAVIVEVGADYGRSSSLISQIAAAKNFLTIHIDPWEEYPDRAKQWMDVVAQRCPWHQFIVLHMTTVAAWTYIHRLTALDGIDLAFIDGCHDPKIVALDLKIVASRVRAGGFLLCHDYPSGGVTEAVDPFVSNGWTKYRQDYGLGTWRRNG